VEKVQSIALDSVVLSAVEERMHPPNVLAAMPQLFDGVIKLKFCEEGQRVVLALLRIRMMKGISPARRVLQFLFPKNRNGDRHVCQIAKQFCTFLTNEASVQFNAATRTHRQNRQ
jgi:hypothetical protein